MTAFHRPTLARLLHAVPLVGLAGFKNLDDNGGAEPPKRSRPRPAAENEPARPRRSLKERRKLLERKLRTPAPQQAPPRPRGS